MFKTGVVVEDFWPFHDSGHPCNAQHLSKRARTGNSLRSALISAMRDEVDVQRVPVNDGFESSMANGNDYGVER